MNDFKSLKPILATIAKGIAYHFGPNCEVLVHNLSKPSYRHTVAIIENGHVTGRKVGDDASEVVLEILRSKSASEHYNYILHTTNGHIVKSSTVPIKDSSGKIIAVFCVNYDISDLVAANSVFSDFIAANPEEEEIGTISPNINDMLDDLIREAHRMIGKPVSRMTKDDKVRAINYLDDKGALLIKKSSERIADFFGISKYTLYNYIKKQPPVENLEED